MTFDEWKLLVKGMKSIYTSDNFLPDANSIAAWFAMVKDLDYKVANAAVQKYIQTNEFPPKPCHIRELANEIIIGKIPEWGDGWMELQEAIRKYGYMRSEEAMASMSPITRETVRRLGFQSLCMSENQMADRANFRQCFEVVANREKQDYMLPQALKETIQQIQQNNILMIGEG